MSHQIAAAQQQKAVRPPPAQGILQRKCACGTHTPGGGRCANCDGDRKDGLRAKLAIGSSNDPLEHEADRVAAQVLADAGPRRIAPARPAIQRRASRPSAGATEIPASVDRTLAASGAPLERRAREDMEQRFGHDFSQVRVHHDAAAGQSARDVGAHAYTVGSHIVFAPGRFAPSSPDGRHLLAHELTHVVQQGGDATLLQRQCVASPCPPALVPIDALYPRYDAAEKCIQTLYASSHPAKPGVSLSYNAEWQHLTGARKQEKMALACLRGVGIPEPGTRGAGPNMTAKSGMYAAAPDIWDFLQQTMYEITTPSGATFRVNKLGAQLKLANALCGPAECGGLQFDRGPWTPGAGCFNLGADLFFTARNVQGVIVYNMFKDATKELLTAALLAAIAVALKNMPKAGGKAALAGAKRLVPAYAIGSLIVMAGLLASGKAEAKAGPGEEPLETLIKALEQKGTPMPPELREMIDANPELKEKMNKALGEGGDIAKAQEEINKQILETIAANKDQFTPEELEVLLASAQVAGGALPKGAMTVQQLKQLAAAAKTGGPAAGSSQGPDAAPSPAAAGSADKGAGAPAQPASADPVTAATRAKLAAAAAPVQQLYGGITAKAAASKLTEAHLRRFLDMVPPNISADQVAKLIERAKPAGPETVDEVLDRLQAALAADQAKATPGGGDPAAGGAAAPPAGTAAMPTVPAPPATAPPPRANATQTIGPTVSGSKAKDPDALIKELAAKAKAASFAGLGNGQYQVAWRKNKKDPVKAGSVITGSLTGKTKEGKAYVGRVEAEVGSMDKKQIKLKFITATPMVTATGEVVFEAGHFLGREEVLDLYVPEKKKSK
ncbi:MAG TPA: DUF4157 domain-containing protein [Allosphingosinicella sp.]|jgi:hypothetical protein|nr:DUF4157 domain-containing protein [Allosphingosinicella sp.]